MIFLSLLLAADLLFIVFLFVQIAQVRRKEIARRKREEQEQAELERERALIPTYTTDEERIAAIHRIMNW